MEKRIVSFAERELKGALEQVRQLKERDSCEVDVVVAAYARNEVWAVDLSCLASLEEKLLGLLALARDPSLGVVDEEKLTALVDMTNYIYRFLGNVDEDVWYNLCHAIHRSIYFSKPNDEVFFECVQVWIRMFPQGF